MRDDELTRLLRENDPASGRELSPDKAASMKRAALTAVPDTSSRSGWQPLLAAATATFIFIVAVLFATRSREAPKLEPVTTETTSMEVTQTTSDPEETTGVRQIQYTTEGGTRIIWTLDPDFQL